MDVDLNLNLFALADGQEVDVLDDLLDRVALDVLGQGQVRFAVDVDVQQGVRGADGQRGCLGGQQDVHDVGAVAVDDCGDLAGDAGLAGCTLAEVGAGGGCELLLRHC